jgi:hypothetical protein
MSGAVYEIDEVRKRIRRFKGAWAQPGRVAEEWKTYEALSSLTPGKPLVIVWPSDEPALPETLELIESGEMPDSGITRSTISSPIDTVYRDQPLPN